MTPPELEKLIAAWKAEFGWLAARFAELRQDVNQIKQAIRDQETNRKDRNP